MNNENPTAPKQRVPESPELRRELRGRLEHFLAGSCLIAPLPLSRLRALAEAFFQGRGYDQCYSHWCIIFINNILWRDVIRRIPRRKRLLMLPFCLRHAASCQATYDDLGLLCADCGRCRIPSLRERADALGLATLVAESSSRVAEWVESGEIEAVIGVSCLESLEKAFPAMSRHAVPGIAIPLNYAGCKDTDFDYDVLAEALAIPEERPLALPGFQDIQEHVSGLFTPEQLDRHLLCSRHRAEEFLREARLALGEHGKHYRPMLTIMCYLALTENADIPAWLDQVALAVECFHKASLIHDDIEDGDDSRYGEPTVHARQGVGVAINLGDYLQGEGYRLLTSAPVPEQLRGILAAVAAEGHCELAIGQAQELEWREGEQTMDMVLDTFRLKTAPAFRVALAMGAVAAGRLEGHQECFRRLSEAMGIAYQLQDDLEDQEEDCASAVFVYARQHHVELSEARRALRASAERYREDAYEALESVKSQPLKSLLFRMIGKVLAPLAAKPVAPAGPDETHGHLLLPEQANRP